MKLEWFLWLSFRHMMSVSDQSLNGGGRAGSIGSGVAKGRVSPQELRRANLRLSSRSFFKHSFGNALAGKVTGIARHS